MDIFDLANEQERMELAPILKDKIQRAFESGRLDLEKIGLYVRLVLPYYRKAVIAAHQQP